MLALLPSIALAACFNVSAPTAELVRAQHGRPDEHKALTCGGGKDEDGRRVPPWKCLVWHYEDKGRIYFAQLDKLGDAPWLVTGCRTGKPAVTAHDGPLWLANHCLDHQHREAACGELGFTIEPTEDFQFAPDEDDDEDAETLDEWERGQMKVCTTRAEARKLAATCAAAPTPDAGAREPRTIKPAQGLGEAKQTEL
ncbi:MAG: hypothetical protein QM767_21710 [Anaeromyxobacter sp.]